MIDIEKAKQELIKHIEEIKIENPQIQKKTGHILRVSQISEEIATKLKLTKEQVELAKLIGLLHDIGRFEQYKIFDNNPTMEKRKFDHGQAGVEVLKNNNYIRKYIEDEKYDNIIYKAIYEHNKYKLSEDLKEDEKIFCKIVKDADKIDLIHEAVYEYWQETERIKLVEEGILSKKMLEEFYSQKLTNIANKVSEADQILRFTSFIYDINFKYSFEILDQNNNISKMIERFNYKNTETKEEMQKVKQIANEYIKQKAKG